MIFKIKKRIEKELTYFVKEIDKIYSISKLSPLLFNNIKEFILRDGKRVRPILFTIGYLGFTKRPAKNLYATALAFELLHDFFLVHDDIIDKSDSRRNKPSMHTLFNNCLANRNNIKFNGQDLAIIAGDVLYAMALQTFLSIKVEMKRKEEALKRFIQASVNTEIGEFIELIYTTKNIEKTERKDILNVYDYKTAHYTFSTPLSIGAMLAGANKNQVNKLTQYGLCLGRAFQIKDDTLSMFADEKEIGKSQLSDLQEAKKTILLWYAYNNSNKKDKLLIKEILLKKNVRKSDLLCIRKIAETSGALDYARKEISKLIKKSNDIISSSAMRAKYRNLLCVYSKKILQP